MLNPLEAYAECGTKAGNARRVGDEAFAAFETKWLHKALALESADDKPIAKAAFNAAYSKARGVIPFRPFR